jgi:pilus assembly protein CpaC
MPKPASAAAGTPRAHAELASAQPIRPAGVQKGATPPGPAKIAPEPPTAKSPPSGKDTAKPAATPPAPAAAKPVPTPPAPATVEDLVREAQLAWMRGQHSTAISKANAALKAQPKPGQAFQAYEIIGTCSCALRDANAAREAASHLDLTKRNTIKAACAKNGVAID